ncbi:MAG: glycerophosphodiester phosphodiesterase [Bacillati bacterium ANGP1]|uniref:Glycerophosphodiester phosphodiesterase n=1 Tax=Candidatus Segetimicrobium genomatis TaxID=2569760 RepID=A0A537JNB0_9BACT|nr:MAG: glycerophosphodiester phosphodiesterase [Terrabacteria group bacterium ANGP1]
MVAPAPPRRGWAARASKDALVDGGVARGSRFLVKGRTLGVAHRGASRYAPENTLAAFRLALEHGVPAVECDVRRTQDGHLVVIHDPAVDRTTDGRGAVGSLTLEPLRRLDAGRWFGPEFAGERIPLLEEVLEAVRGRALIQIEIKNDPAPSEGIEQQVAGALRDHGMEDEALVMSFDHRIIRELRSAAPRIAACVQWGYLDRDVVDSAHRAGLGVFVWTVDDEQAIGRCRDLGVDGITSNDTRLLTRLLGGA